MTRKAEYLTPDGLRRLQDEARQLRAARRPEIANRRTRALKRRLVNH